MLSNVLQLKRVREAVTSDNGRIVCTVNSFTSDEYASYDDANGDDYNSAKRYQVVMDSFMEKITDNYLDTTTRLLKGNTALCANMKIQIFKQSGVRYST